jgi:hypothetical protein
LPEIEGHEVYEVEPDYKETIKQFKKMTLRLRER